MHILVLDSIHGGRAISEAFSAQGHMVDLVDVYRGESAVDVKTAQERTYGLVVAPVHLDPDHPLLKCCTAPVISHHEAVRRLLGRDIPNPMIEITGARGKTTTAHALASLMKGRGILHTSSGTFRLPEKEMLGRSSITPASVLTAARKAQEIYGWLIAEESLGVSGAGTLGIITSPDDYTFASGKKHAIKEKISAAKRCSHLLLAEHISIDDHDGVVHIENVARCDGAECRITMGGKTYGFVNPLLALPAYRESLMLAAAAALMLGIDPVPLAAFTTLPGRMSVSYKNGVLVVDNSNSGTRFATTLEAARYAQSFPGNRPLTLVIGQAQGDGAVCEGFLFGEIMRAINQIHPDRVVWVGASPVDKTGQDESFRSLIVAHAYTLEEGRTLALQMTEKGSIVLAVKTWR